MPDVLRVFFYGWCLFFFFQIQSGHDAKGYFEEWRVNLRNGVKGHIDPFRVRSRVEFNDENHKVLLLEFLNFADEVVMFHLIYFTGLRSGGTSMRVYVESLPSLPSSPRSPTASSHAQPPPPPRSISPKAGRMNMASRLRAMVTMSRNHKIFYMHGEALELAFRRHLQQHCSHPSQAHTQLRDRDNHRSPMVACQ
jgi:hypothetical protein